MKGERISKSVSILMHGMLKIPTSYKTHSVRGTSASSLLSSGMSVSLILERANWASHATFLRYYKKDFIDAGELVTYIFQNKINVAPRLLLESVACQKLWLCRKLCLVKLWLPPIYWISMSINFFRIHPP